MREQTVDQNAVQQAAIKQHDDAGRKELATKGDIQDVRDEIHNIHEELKHEIAEIKHEILKWMVTGLLAL